MNEQEAMVWIDGPEEVEQMPDDVRKTLEETEDPPTQAAHGWNISIMIPHDQGEEMGRELADHLGLTPFEGGRRYGGWLFDFHIRDFEEAKIKASQSISWLVVHECAVQTSWGDPVISLQSLDEESLRGINAMGGLFNPQNWKQDHAFVQLWDNSGSVPFEWPIRFRRMAIWLAGPAPTNLVEAQFAGDDELQVALTRSEATALLDLSAETCRDVLFIEHLKSIGEINVDFGAPTGSLQKIVEKLRVALQGHQSSGVMRPN
jgi:hypothetical protein